MRSLLATFVVLLLLAIATNGAGLTKFFDDKREGELPVDDASPKAILGHAHLATIEARTQRKFKGDVIAVLPHSSGPGTASELELWKSQDAILRFASKVQTAVGEYMDVYRSNTDAKPFFVEAIAKEQFNRTFVRNLQAKKTQVVSLVKFDKTDFPDHDEFKNCLLSKKGVSDLVAQITKHVKKMKIDGVVLDMPNFEFDDLGTSRAILNLLKRLTRSFSEMQDEDDEPHQVGILLRSLDHFTYKEWINVQDAVDFFIVGARVSPLAEQVYPNPTLEEAKTQVKSICRNCGERKMKKHYKNKVAVSYDMLGHSAPVGAGGYGTRFPMSQFIGALQKSSSTAADCNGNAALAHPVEVEWNDQRDEFEYKIARDIYTASAPDSAEGQSVNSECLPKASKGEPKMRAVVPSLKSFKMHLDQLTKLKSAIAIWNFGLGHRYMFEIL